VTRRLLVVDGAGLQAAGSSGIVQVLLGAL
jgi:hypothetical protein